MKKTAENCRNCYCQKSHSFQTVKYIGPKLIEQIEYLNKDCIKISRPYLLYFPKNKHNGAKIRINKNNEHLLTALWSGRTGSPL